MGSYYPTEDPFLNATRGLIRGGKVVNIFGNTLDETGIVSSEFRTPWEFNSDYQFPPTATIMTVASSAADNVSILINGLDIDYKEISEVIILVDGVAQNTQNEFLRINDVITISGNALGNISVSANSIIYGYITAGAGRNQAAYYTVPAGNCYYLYRIDAFSTDQNGGKAAVFRNFVVNKNDVNFRVAQTEFFASMNIQRKFPFKYDEKSDIKLQLKATATTLAGSVFAEGLLLNEPSSTS